MLVLGRAVRFPNLEKEEMKATCAPPFRTCNNRKGNPPPPKIQPVSAPRNLM